MWSPHRMKSGLAVAAIIAGVAGIGWVARSTRAQDSKSPTPAPPLEATPVEPAPAAPSPVVLPGPKVAEPVPPPADPADAGGPALPPIGAREANPAPQSEDDPEKHARAFVEQNRKVAQDELKKLKEEAERLRSRLGKVEAGIRRWEALVAALDEGDKTAAMLKAAIPPPQATPAPEKDIARPPAPR